MLASQKLWDLFHLYDTKHGRATRDEPPSSGPIGDRYKILQKEQFEVVGWKFVFLVDNRDTNLAHLPNPQIEDEEERKLLIKYPLSPLRPINEYGFTPTLGKRNAFKSWYKRTFGELRYIDNFGEDCARRQPEEPQADNDKLLDFRGDNEGKAFVEAQTLSLEEADLGSDGAGLANYDSD